MSNATRLTWDQVQLYIQKVHGEITEADVAAETIYVTFPNMELATEFARTAFIRRDFHTGFDIRWNGQCQDPFNRPVLIWLTAR